MPNAGQPTAPDRQEPAFSALDALRAAHALTTHGLTDPDAITTADIDAAADHADTIRPESADDRHAVRIALAAGQDT